MLIVISVILITENCRQSRSTSLSVPRGYPLTLLQRLSECKPGNPASGHRPMRARALATMGNEVDAVLQRREPDGVGKTGYPSPAMLADAPHV